MNIADFFSPLSPCSLPALSRRFASLAIIFSIASTPFHLTLSRLSGSLPCHIFSISFLKGNVGVYLMLPVSQLLGVA